MAAKQDLKKDNGNTHANVEGRSLMGLQPWAKSYKKLRNAGSGRK